MPRPLILGEAPSRTRDATWALPLFGPTGERLAAWAGLAPLVDGTRYGRHYWPLRARYDLANLLPRWPGAQGKGCRFPTREARAALAELDLDGRVVVLLGRRLAHVAGLPDFHRWADLGGATAAAIPHPSGLNLVYNDPAERARAGDTLRAARALAAGGDSIAA